MLFNNNNSDEAGGVRTSASPLALRWTFAGHDVGPPIKTNPYVTYEDQKAATYTSEIGIPASAATPPFWNLNGEEARRMRRTNNSRENGHNILESPPVHITCRVIGTIQASSMTWRCSLMARKN
ncbi:hypothetical protein I305_00102 [Cryptococcus gattii E566]|uniref:Uncharacterized protein n=2 Tax=Cryptococcus gattii TaxID=37769 RepID=E6QXP5_CRYGW|nr:Hypothetical Protein CGB_A4360W [Cryptococcus gattii WM276]ADV19607.1 Hypothetical Protein CGB_A4360W [Cryptococcus gattii WM276]KIR79720.1 hypothetical protein I306_03178 [Cryptococcus gattii EJB2]KIY37013.1 hypothetical protein I305_00102 [Cryptococcus gattii E566]